MKKNLIFLLVLSALLGVGTQLEGMSPKERRAKHLEAAERRQKEAAAASEAERLAQEQRKAEEQAQRETEEEARRERVETVREARQQVFAGTTPEAIRGKQVQLALEALKREKVALENNPEFQSLLAQIEQQKAEVSQSKQRKRQLERESPKGPREWRDIKFTHERAESIEAEAQSLLKKLKEDPTYQRYQQLQREIAAAPPPAAAAAAAAIEEEEEEEEEEEWLRAAPYPAPPPASPAPAKKSILRQHPYLTGTGAAVLITALYGGLKWYQRRRILRALRGHDLNLTMLSPTQKDALAAAVMASYRVPRSMRKLAVLVQRVDFASADVTEQTMWEMIAELYYRKAPTTEQIEVLKSLLNQ